MKEVLKCLVVDDNEDNRFILARLLSDLGAATDEVTDGKSALKYLQDHTPHIVFLDWKMPGMNGLEVFLAMRSNYKEQAKEMPVVILCTAVNEKGALETALEEGINGLLLKPFDEENIVQCLKQVGIFLN
ncbi:MAG: response regulator [Rickettsiales bacterium]|jgi:CheY-like chemotaxis protein|nr:response regulator [Rickettsiales bacterium]